MKLQGRLTVILFGACAVIWTIRATLDVVYHTYNVSVFGFVLNVLCAVTWIAAFVINLKRCRSNEDEQ